MKYQSYAMKHFAGIGAAQIGMRLGKAMDVAPYRDPLAGIDFIGDAVGDHRVTRCAEQAGY